VTPVKVLKLKRGVSGEDIFRIKITPFTFQPFKKDRAKGGGRRKTLPLPAR
jgi:hypothetical protein